MMHTCLYQVLDCLSQLWLTSLPETKVLIEIHVFHTQANKDETHTASRLKCIHKEGEECRKGETEGGFK